MGNDKINNIISHSCPTIELDDIIGAEKSLKEKNISAGEISRLFAAELKKFFKAKAVILTPSGAAAIVQALNLLDLKPGAEVIIPAYVCSRVAKAVLTAGAKPVVVDINRDDYNISYKAAVNKISEQTKAIILPSLFGNPIREIKDFLKTGVTVIEDIAQSLGAEFQGKRLGSFGDLGVCSFYATKVITTGEGGALIINNEKLGKKIDKNAGFFKMPDFQAAVGLSQLRKLNKFIKSRKAIADRYIKELEDFPNIKVLRPAGSIYYRFIIETETRADKIIDHLNSRGVKAERFTDVAANFLKLNLNNCPNTKAAMRQVISLPIYPSLSGRNLRYIIKCLKEIIKSLK